MVKFYKNFLSREADFKIIKECVEIMFDVSVDLCEQEYECKTLI